MSQQDKSEFLRVFSARLKARRERLSLNQAELAQRLGVSSGAVGNWESGQNGPSRKRIKSIAEKLGVSFEYLTGESDSMFPQADPGSALAERPPVAGGKLAGQCFDHLGAFIDRCQGDQAKLGWTLVELQDTFPLNKWETSHPDPSLPFNSGAHKSDQVKAVAEEIVQQAVSKHTKHSTS